MKSRLSRALIVGSGIAAVAVVTAASALAHGKPFTVTAGSAPNLTKVAITATSGTVAFTDTTSGVPLSCTKSVLKGTLKTTTAAKGPKIVTVSGKTAKFSGCTGPAGLQFAVTGFGTWSVNVTDSTSGVSTGTITAIRAHVASTSGPTCAFDVGSNTGSFTSSGTSTVSPGTVAGSYTNSTHALDVPASNPGSLGLWNVLGSGGNTYCVAPSVLAQGNSASFSATYSIVANVAADNPVAIN
jgi:hypothetical protein